MQQLRFLPITRRRENRFSRSDVFRSEEKSALEATAEPLTTDATGVIDIPKEIPDKQLHALLHLFASFPDGASLEQITENPVVPLPRHTLQRQLALLVDRGDLTLDGTGRWTRYRLARSE